MNECIYVFETVRVYDASGEKAGDNKMKELADKLLNNKSILESLSIN